MKNGTNMNGGTNGHAIVAASRLPANIPDGAKAFQAAVDGKLTREIWEQILDAQIAKTKEGDRGAARFLLEYAGGVASMRGATFVQENHQHDHYHGDDGPPLTNERTENADHDVDGIPKRTPADFHRERERRARSASNRVGAGKE
jgi:hypothetical protein